MNLSLLCSKTEPLWLREKLFWSFPALRATIPLSLFENANLRFAPGVRLALKSTDIAHKQIAFLGYMERELTVLMSSLAERGGLLVDVGANYGYFTCLWAAARNTNRVIAFEGSPRNVDALKTNVERNRLGESVTIAPVAAGRARGRMQFSLGPENETGWGGLSVGKKEDQIEVDVVTLNDYFQGEKVVPEIAVLKVDTEGADTWVLQGCEPLLQARRIRNIFFETNPDRMSELGIEASEAVTLLTKHGYRLNRMGNEGWHAFA
jgi:FkbM family methyltransferase